MDKQKIIEALELAVADHRAFAGSLTDWNFVDALLAAKCIVEAAPETSVPVALVTAAAKAVQAEGAEA